MTLRIFSIVFCAEFLIGGAIGQYAPAQAPSYASAYPPSYSLPPLPVAYPTPSQSHSLVLDVHNINPDTIPIYDFRPLLELWAQLELELEKKIPKNFDKIIDLGTPNPQAKGEKPITYIRQLLAAVVSTDNQAIVPSDVTQHAKELLAKFSGNSIGSYTDPRGLLAIRQHVESFIWKRDYVAANASHIFLANGRLEALRDIFKLAFTFVDRVKRGVLIPAPNCPHYEEIAHFERLCRTPYRLDEENNWIVTSEALQAAFDDQSQYCVPVALLAVNPHLPTGHVLTREEIELLINFANDHQLILIVDEGNQDEILDDDSKFIAVRKVAADLKKNVEVVSIMGTSYSWIGEAGLRGAAYEFFYLDPEVVDQWVEAVRFLKFSPNAAGQVVVEGLVNPPKKGDPSYVKWEKERSTNLGHVKHNALVVVEWSQETPGITVSPVQGGIIAFAKLDLPDAFISRANDLVITPDWLWTLELLKREGVVVLPGALLAQPDGSSYVSIDLNIDPKDLRIALRRIEVFQKFILDTYSNIPTLSQS